MMLNKRAQASGLAWFFALVAIAFILILFYVSTLGILTKKADESKIVGNYFYEVQNIRETSKFLDYSYDGVFNPVPNLIYSNDESKLRSLFFSYIKDIYGIDKNNYEGKNFCKGLRLAVNIPNLFGDQIIGIQRESYQGNFKVSSPIISTGIHAAVAVTYSFYEIYPYYASIYLLGDNDKYTLFGIGAGGACNEYAK